MHRLHDVRAECPVYAIVGENEIAESQRQFIGINARLARHPDWKPITRSRPALPDHEEWRQVRNKLYLLSEK